MGIEAINETPKMAQDSKPGIRLPERFSAMRQVVLRDMNDIYSASGSTIKFGEYSKTKIQQFLKNPSKYEQELRRAAIYIYGASSHFRRLIQYFVGLTDLAYVVSPYQVETKAANRRITEINYKKCLNLLSSMNIRSQFPKILTVCLREDVFYGTIRKSDRSITIQQLPSDYCSISSIEENVPNVTFDFSYFSRKGNQDLLEFYPEEFRERYERFRNKQAPRYQELNSPESFAIKCNSDILDYAIPPFAGILPAIYDIQDYKDLKLTKTALENYAILVMNLGVDAEGNWVMDYEKARDFWMNLDHVLPEEVGSVLSPMPITKIGFDRSNTGDTDTIAEAEENLFTESGVSSLLFNNARASGTALLLSIKADQAITFGIVKSIEDMVNRYLHAQAFGKSFRLTFLDCSPFNRKELGDMYLKACTYGLPFISMYAASQGLNQSEVDAMNFLEADVLGLVDKFKPLRSSATLSADSTNEGGAPKKDPEDLTENGEKSREVN